MKNKRRQQRNGRRGVNPATILDINNKIEKLQYDEDYYEENDDATGVEGEDWVWGMKGEDGNYYDMEEADGYDKDFFRGRPIRLSMFGRRRGGGGGQPPPRTKPPRRRKKGMFPALKRVYGIANSSATILPTKPEQRPATKAEIMGSDQFDITVKKTIVGAGIPNNLPFILFSPAFRRSNYSELIPALPAGVTLSVDDSGDNDLTFTYISGANSVVLTISSDTTAYRTILEALTTDRFDIVKTRESISDNTILSQVGLSLRVSNGSLFGGQSFNKLSAVATKSPDQFQDGIIDFDAVFPLNKFRAVQGFMAATAPDQFEARFSFWAMNVVKY